MIDHFSPSVFESTYIGGNGSTDSLFMAAKTVLNGQDSVPSPDSSDPRVSDVYSGAVINMREYWLVH